MKHVSAYRYLICKISCSMMLLYMYNPIQAQSITVGGADWIATIPAIAEAGNDYVGTYESPADQIQLNVGGPLLLGNVKVAVHYEPNPTWHNALSLSIKRTGNGTTLCLLCTINNGIAYQQITPISTYLFDIKTTVALAAYSNIPFQLRLTGISVTVPAASYKSKVVFTIMSP